MDERVIEEDLAGRDVLYDDTLADQSIAAQKAAIRNARALIVRNRMQVTDEILASAPKLRVVGRLGVGLDNIDLNACTTRNIAVCPALNANSLSVAEYVLMAALMLLRRAWHSSELVAQGRWPRQAAGQGRELAGKRLGLIGYGATARLTAVKARALEMSVVAYDPYLHREDAAWQGVRKLELNELLAIADVVSVHVPLNDETRNLIDAVAIAKMRPTAILVNSARGGIVDEEAVVLALRGNRLAGAALDVFLKEPVDKQNGAMFVDAPNLLLTPHIAGVTVESNSRISRVTVQNVVRYLDEQGART